MKRDAQEGLPKLVLAIIERPRGLNIAIDSMPNDNRFYMMTKILPSWANVNGVLSYYMSKVRGYT